MESDTINSSKISFAFFIRKNGKALIILFFGFVLTIVATNYTDIYVEKQTKKEFILVCNEIKTKISSRLHAHAQLLRNGASFFAVSDTVKRLEWKIYIENAKLNKNLPGIQGVGFSFIIPKSELQNHIQRIRNEGFTDYTVKPEGEREIYTSIIFLEPFTDRNLRAFGYDMYSEPVRRKAMQQARDFDVAALSGKVILKQETNKDLQAGTLMYVPVYKRGMPTKTIEDRRAAIVGWVYSPYRMNDLMNGILGRWDDDNSLRIRLQVYDNEIFTDSSILFDSQPQVKVISNELSLRNVVLPIEFNEKRWSLRFSQFKDSYTIFSGKPLIVLASGSIISILLFSLYLSLSNTKHNARRIADKLTNELKESEARWKFAIEGSGDGLWDWNLETNEVFFSTQWKAMLGFEEHEISNHLDEWGKRVHPDDLQNCYTDIQMHINGVIPLYSNIHRVSCKDNTHKWILDRGKIVSFDQNGKPLRMIGTHTDLTKQMKIEEALKESQSKISAILHTLPDMMFIQDIQGVYTDFYVPKNAVTNLPPKVYVGQKIENVLPPNLVQLFLPLFEKAIQTNQMQMLEYELLMPDRLHYYEARTVCFDTNKVLSIVRDITDRKDAEYMLEQTRRNYETFFNTIDDFLFVLDEQGAIIHTNNTVIKRLEYSKEELEGKSVLMVHPPERREEAGRIVGEMLQGISEFCPVPVITKSGIPIDVETKVTRGVWDGRPVLFGVTKDISQIKLSEEKFSKIFHLNSAIMALSIFEDGTFIDVNEAFLKALGYTKAEIIGKSSLDINLFVDTNARQTLASVLGKKNSEREIELEICTKDGKHKLGLFSAEKIYIGHRLCLLTTMIDITFRKEAEQIITKQNIELKKLNSDKDRFMSILAHDLRSPFSSILGFLDLLLTHLHKYDIKKIEHQLNIVNDSSKMLYNLLDDLLSWTRVQAGKMIYNPVNVDFHSICSEVIENLHINASNKEIVINQLATDGYWLYADTNMLKTILRNLISNAIKFTHSGGNIHIYIREENTFAIVTVSDNGVGIEADSAAKLFDITQLHSTEGTNNEKGTGLGLILCKEFVEKHGGRIWVESQIGMGSDFHFKLPMARG